MTAGTLDHVNIRTWLFEESLHFYQHVLGLERGPRPNFTLPGAWLYSGGRVVLHLVDLRSTDEPQNAGSGVIDHIAFASTGFHATREHLKSSGASFETREGPERTVWQIFVRDPSGVSIELNFVAENERPAPSAATSG